jgi:hypothetical protein
LRTKCFEVVCEEFFLFECLLAFFGCNINIQTLIVMLKPKVIPQVLQQAQTNGVKAVRYELQENIKQ